VVNLHFHPEYVGWRRENRLDPFRHARTLHRKKKELETMSPQMNEWIEMLLRWAHIFAGIMWVGATFYFTWLDGRFNELEKQADKGDGKSEKNVWMVHSGGFYLVEKQKRPQMMPQTLHWFKWESFVTWFTGILLFGLMYYHGTKLIEFEDWPFSKGQAMAMSVGFLLGGWIVYDLLWSKVFKNELVGAVISYLLLFLVAFLFMAPLKLEIGPLHIDKPPLFPARAAFLQIGVMLGTIMTANVWMRILPPQKRMVAALKAGQEPILTEGASAKARSKHNTFIVMPVVFTMISHHYSFIGSKYNWLIFIGLTVLGFVATKIIRRA
jgi:uncharacterized membrane protein